MELSIVSLIVFGLGVIALPLIFMKLISPDTIKKRPSYAFVVAAFFALIGFLAAFFVFSVSLSMAMIAFGSLLILPFIVKILEPTPEEEVAQEVAVRSGINLDFFSRSFKKHERVIVFYMLLFFGMAVEYMLLFTFLPPSISDNAFAQQLQLFGPSGQFSLPFASILINNLQILFIAFALSVFYGAGSILVLSYNASIVGVMYGAPMKLMIWGAVGAAPLYSHILSYIPHTVLEIAAYLFAAVAGGILATRRQKDDILEASVLFCVALVLVFVAYFVELTVPGSF